MFHLFSIKRATSSYVGIEVLTVTDKCRENNRKNIFYIDSIFNLSKRHIHYVGIIDKKIMSLLHNTLTPITFDMTILNISYTTA